MIVAICSSFFFFFFLPRVFFVPKGTLSLFRFLLVDRVVCLSVMHAGHVSKNPALPLSLTRQIDKIPISTRCTSIYTGVDRECDNSFHRYEIPTSLFLVFFFYQIFRLTASARICVKLMLNLAVGPLAVCHGCSRLRRI